MKKIYFISDVHLALDREKDTIDRKNKLLSFLEYIEDEASKIVFAGDLFDFWFEWYYVIPGFHFDLFSKFKEMIKNGIEIVYLTGNHDFHLSDFLTKEIGMNCIDETYTFEVGEKKFFVAHGDGYAKVDSGYRFLKKILRSKISNFLFKTLIHPDLGILFAKLTSGSSRKYRTIDRSKWRDEYLDFAKTKFMENFNYVILGHLHDPVIEEVNGNFYLNTGDWINHFSYGVFDGEELELKYYK
ncbi:MAG: UDP-2,3-diacylglucosamine diphosphatase [Candidatus Delongbacteria bacterium]|nr:UDP-2,3-diacylglucosamine diphosphatase [Candidatus Delongbacteria bacterium]